MTYLLVFPSMGHGGYGSDLASAESSTLISGVVYSLVAGLILVGIGAAIGALGGVIGRGQSMPAQQYSPYMSNPYQAQVPIYPVPNPNPYAPSAQPGGPVQPGQTPPYPPISGQ